ncbi:MAG: putative molybdenum carrier protein [Deltaproteobacteria bacterium]
MSEKNLKIISGGQTGADRAALDVAIRKGFAHGGWIPKGRLTEAGPLPEKYKLQETATESYSQRTEKNIQEADGTVILSHGILTGGSSLTEKLAQKHGKPLLHLNLDKISLTDAARRLHCWLAANEIEVVNVAGTRASTDPEIYDATVQVLELALCIFKNEK